MSIAETGYTPALSRSFLDPEIVQRVLKVSDFIVLFAGTTALFMQSAISLDPQLATMMTFASMVMVLAVGSTALASPMTTVQLDCLRRMRRAWEWWEMW